MDKLIVFCCSCGNHYPITEVKKVKTEASKGKLYICTGCYDNIPIAQEPVIFEIVR